MLQDDSEVTLNLLFSCIIKTRIWPGILTIIIMTSLFLRNIAYLRPFHIQRLHRAEVIS